MKHQRLIHILCLAVFIFSFLSSVIFIALESNHNCDGDDCTVCFQLCLCKYTLKALTLTSLALFSLLMIQNHSCISTATSEIRDIRSDLITLKVKLSR